MVKALSGYFLTTQLYCKKAVFQKWFVFLLNHKLVVYLVCGYVGFLLFYLKKKEKRQALIILFSSMYELVCEVSVTE